MRKHESTDTVFIEKRNDFFKNQRDLDPKYIVEQWPLFIGYVPLGEMLGRYELLKMVQNVPGHILEFGCFHGAHLAFMAKIMQLLAPHDFREIYGFDSFEGLTQFADQDGKSSAERGNYKGNLEFLKKILKFHSLDDRVKLVVGNIESTLPEFLKKNAHHIYSYIYLDTDLYQSTAVVLNACWPRLAQGGIIALDEGYHDRFPGEGAALQEFLRTIPGQYECGHFPFARQPMLWIRKK